MRRFMKSAVLLCVGLLVCMEIAGCACCPPKAPRETMMVPHTEEPVAPVGPVEPEPTPPPVVEQPKPEPVPPAVVKAVEDLDKQFPGLFTFDKDKGLFMFTSDTTFDSGSAVVRSEAKTALTKLAEILNGDQVKDRHLTIIGHTDSDRVIKRKTIAGLKALGKPADNQGLSEARAEAVGAVLQAGGIDAGRMTTEGKGQTQPIADNRTPAGKAKNRRVSVYLTPMSK